MASSAKRACRLLRSASEYTATVRMPRSLHAQITRRAISPRLAMRIFSNIASIADCGYSIERVRRGEASARTYGQQGFAVLHRPAVFDQLGRDHARYLRL